jgi:hypothetical protein
MSDTASGVGGCLENADGEGLTARCEPDEGPATVGGTLRLELLPLLPAKPLLEGLDGRRLLLLLGSMANSCGRRCMPSSQDQKQKQRQKQKARQGLAKPSTRRFTASFVG